MRGRVVSSLMLMALALSACGTADEATPGAEGEDGGDNGEATSTEGDFAGSITIGFIDALTGSGAVYGGPQEDAVEIAVDWVNENGGVTLDGEQYSIELNKCDNQGDPTESLTCVRNLIDRDGVKYLTGFAISGATIPVAEAFAQEDAVMVVGTAAAESITTHGAENVFRVRSPSPYTGGPAGEYVAEQGVQRLAVVGQLEAEIYGDYFERFEESFTDAGGEIVAVESFGEDDRDMYSQLTSVQGSDPDALFVPGFVEQAAFVFRQAHELGFEGDIYGFTGGAPEQFLEVATEEQMEGIIDLRPIELDPETIDGDYVDDFIDTYRERFDETPAPNSGYGFDAFMALVFALQEAGTDDVDAVGDALRSMEIPSSNEVLLSYSPINGTWFDENGQAYVANGAFEWVDGGWSLVAELPSDAESFSAYLSEQSG